MIRRPAALACLTLAALVLGSGCSTFTKNKVAAEANDHELSVSELERITNDLGKTDLSQFTPNAAGEITGASVRSIVNEWITTRLGFDALADAGVPVDQAAIDAARTTAQSQFGDENWAKMSAESQSFLAENLAVTQLLRSGANVTPEVARAAYEAGLETSKTLCIRYIAAESPEQADALYQQLLDGADFASLADAQPDAPGNGGVFADAGGSPCSDASSVNPALQQIGETPIGQPAPPITLSAQDGSQATYLFLQRPWAEIADAALPVIKGTVGLASVYEGADVRVDSRYGTWDADAKGVDTVK